ncbi:hypothetical protein Q9R08_05080 [Microbacterium sp. QXD-8]|uniref:Uncharacterized protein n=1 Tax=Microbacterium psychrotolerans TaxID=3068321 RepID=A0ABU0Z0L6_9MICO|nr:hypothetical protein [Microbacterium sp. QXD-8]MDQ7877346.1 hypothetical protein [Microbacterium sp. QXD-8]
MNAREVNVLLTKAALLDPRMKRVDPTEQADMAIEWAFVLDDVALGAGLWSIRQHYRTESRSITPADVVRLAGEYDDDTANTTAQRERAQRDEWLRANGFEPSEWDRLIGAGHTARELLARKGIDPKEIDA